MWCVAVCECVLAAHGRAVGLRFRLYNLFSALHSQPGGSWLSQGLSTGEVEALLHSGTVGGPSQRAVRS